VFKTADYTNRDVLNIILKIVPPILFNLKLTSSKDEAADVVADIFAKIRADMPAYTQQALNTTVSALSQLQERELQEKNYEKLQSTRDIYQQTLNYQVVKH